MLFLDNAAQDSCCAERPLHIPTYPRLVSTAATVREKTWEQTDTQTAVPTDTQTDRPTTITLRCACARGLIIMPSGARRCIIVSTRVIRLGRGLGQIKYSAEGSCFCLATVSDFSLCLGPSASDCRRLPSRAREHAATSPLSRVTAAAFPPASEYATASSFARDHACVLCLCDRPPYSAYGVSPALSWRLYQVPIQL